MSPHSFQISSGVKISGFFSEFIRLPNSNAAIICNALVLLTPFPEADCSDFEPFYNYNPGFARYATK